MGFAGGVVTGGAGGVVTRGAGGVVTGRAGGVVTGRAGGVVECAVAVGLGAEECAVTAVLQPAVSAASSATPAADRARGKDMDQPFSVHGFGGASCVHIAVMRTPVIRLATLPRFS